VKIKYFYVQFSEKLLFFCKKNIYLDSKKVPKIALAIFRIFFLLVGAWGATCFAVFTAFIGFANRNTSVLLSLVIESLPLGFSPYASNHKKKPA